MKILVFSYDEDEDRMFVDCVPVSDLELRNVPQEERADEAVRIAGARIDCIRGDVARVISVSGLSFIQEILRRLAEVDDVSLDAALCYLEDGQHESMEQTEALLELAERQSIPR